MWLLSDVYTANSRYAELVSPHELPNKKHLDTWTRLLGPLPTSHIWHLSNLFDWFEAEEQQWEFDPGAHHPNRAVSVTELKQSSDTPTCSQ